MGSTADNGSHWCYVGSDQVHEVAVHVAAGKEHDVTGIEQLRRTVRVLDLMTKSFEAHERGDGEASGNAIDEALACDAQAVTAVHGGMLIGEVPDPERDLYGWDAYVAAAHDRLARAGEDS
jgi:hypothetical protein